MALAFTSGLVWLVLPAESAKEVRRLKAELRAAQGRAAELGALEERRATGEAVADAALRHKIEKLEELLEDEKVANRRADVSSAPLPELEIQLVNYCSSSSLFLFVFHLTGITRRRSGKRNLPGCDWRPTEKQPPRVRSGCACVS